MMSVKTHNVLFYILSAIVVIAFIFVCQPAGLYFLNDDFEHVPWAINNLFFDHQSSMRHVGNFSLWLGYHMWGMNYTGFYISNLVFHLLNTVLIFFLTKTLLQSFLQKNPQLTSLPFYSALLFLVYASHSEPIFWIVGRGGSLVTIFIQSSILFYLNTGFKYKILSYISLVIALFTYELSWSLPLIITVLELYENFFLKRKQPAVFLICYWLIFFIFLYFRYFVSDNVISLYEARAFLEADFFSLLYNFSTSFARVFIPPIEESYLLVSAVVLVFFFFLYAGIRIRKQSQSILVFLFFCLLCICISLIPIMSLGADTHDSEGERFLYSASIFFCIFISAIVCTIKNVKMRLISFSLVLFFQFLFFYRSSLDYRCAGYATRYIVDEVNKLPLTDSIEFQNMPSACRGALIFRVGFPKGAKGILNKEFKEVNVTSYSEILSRNSYKTIYMTNDHLVSKVIFKFKKDTLFVYR